MINAIIKKAQEDTNTKVNVSVLEWGNYYTKLNAAFSSGKTPDIGIMHLQYFLPYAKSGLLANISALEKKTGIYLKNIEEPSLIKAQSYKGNIYGIRWDIHGLLWHINKEEFKKAGLLDKEGNPLIPTSPEEFIKEARKYKESTGNPFVVWDGATGEGIIWWWYSLLLQDGGQFINKDQTKAAFNTEAGLETLKFINTLVKEKLIDANLNLTQAANAFINGKSASFMNGTWWVNTLYKDLGDKLYTTIIPILYHKGAPAVWANSHMWIIPANISSEKQAEAYKFIVAMLKYNVYWAKTGHAPVVQLSEKEKNYLMNLPERDHYYTQLLKNAAPFIQKFPGDPYATVLPEFQKVFFEGADPAKSLKNAEKKQKEIIEKYLRKTKNKNPDYFSVLNDAYVKDGAFIYVPDNVKLEKPIYILHFIQSDNGNIFSQNRNLIIAGKNTSFKVIHTFHSLSSDFSFNNTVTDICLDDDAQAEYYLFEGEGNTAAHVNRININSEKGSSFKSNVITFCGSVVRNNFHADFFGEHAEIDLKGIYMPDKEQQVHNFINISHSKPNCRSNQLFKGLIDNKAVSVFTGKVFVARDAQKTDSAQSNQNLLLTDYARAHSRPQLEIYADDVACSHGSTTGQLDKEALFYMKTRGISEKKAKTMLMNAFLKDVTTHISEGSYRNYVNFLINKRLKGQHPESLCNIKVCPSC